MHVCPKSKPTPPWLLFLLLSSSPLPRLLISAVLLLISLPIEARDGLFFDKIARTSPTDHTSVNFSDEWEKLLASNPDFAAPPSPVPSSNKFDASSFGDEPSSEFTTSSFDDADTEKFHDKKRNKHNPDKKKKKTRAAPAPTPSSFANEGPPADVPSSEFGDADTEKLHDGKKRNKHDHDKKKKKKKARAAAPATAPSSFDDDWGIAPKGSDATDSPSPAIAPVVEF